MANFFTCTNDLENLHIYVLVWVKWDGVDIRISFYRGHWSIFLHIQRTYKILCSIHVLYNWMKWDSGDIISLLLKQKMTELFMNIYYINYMYERNDILNK